MTETELQQVVTTEQQLQQLLVATASDGVPELALATILRDYADLIEEVGYVPRTWKQD
jgi:hypothetical protein